MVPAVKGLERRWSWCGPAVHGWVPTDILSEISMEQNPDKGKQTQSHIPNIQDFAIKPKSQIQKHTTKTVLILDEKYHENRACCTPKKDRQKLRGSPMGFLNFRRNSVRIHKARRNSTDFLPEFPCYPTEN